MPSWTRWATPTPASRRICSAAVLEQLRHAVSRGPAGRLWSCAAVPDRDKPRSVYRSNSRRNALCPHFRASKPHGGPRPSSSRRSSRVSDHLAGEVERYAPSRRPRAAGWARQAAQLFNGQVVLGGLDGLTRGIVTGLENPAPSQGDLVVGLSLGDVPSIAEHEMTVMGSKLQTSHKNDLTLSREAAEGEKTQTENIRQSSGMNQLNQLFGFCVYSLRLFCGFT